MQKFYNYCNDIELELDRLIIEIEFDPILETYQNYCTFLKLLCNKDGELLSASLINKSLLAVKTYLDWLILYYCKDRKLFKIYREILCHIKSCNLLKIKTDRFSYKALTDTELGSVLDIVNPGSIYNPFAESYRIRNYLIFMVLYETGARKSEVLKLKTTDIIESENSFFIQFRPNINDPTDTRSVELGFKTLNRTVEITEKLWLLIDIYIDNSRNPHKKQNKHLYLLTSRTFKPLSSSGLQYIFTTLKKSANGLNITPHILRHTFVTNLLKFLIDNQKLDMEQALDQLRYLCGWCNTSRMPERHGRKYLAELGNRFNVSADPDLVGLQTGKKPVLPLAGLLYHRRFSLRCNGVIYKKSQAPFNVNLCTEFSQS